jgi:hypothetical protein
MHGRRWETCIKFWLESLKERDNSEDLGVDGSIKVDYKEIGWEGVECINLYKDMVRWLAVVTL